MILVADLFEKNCFPKGWWRSHGLVNKDEVCIAHLFNINKCSCDSLQHTLMSTRPRKKKKKKTFNTTKVWAEKYKPQKIPLYVRLYLTPGLMSKSAKSPIFLVSAQGDVHVHGLSQKWYLEYKPLWQYWVRGALLYLNLAWVKFIVSYQYESPNFFLKSVVCNVELGLIKFT